MKHRDDIKGLMKSQESFQVPSVLENLVMDGVKSKVNRKSTISLLRMSLVYSVILVLYVVLVVFLKDLVSSSELFQDLQKGLLLSLIVYTIYGAVSIFVEVTNERVFRSIS
ncbi:MAG: hypothetical protein ACPGTP_05255 [Bacteroidia bacterium]